MKFYFYLFWEKFTFKKLVQEKFFFTNLINTEFFLKILSNFDIIKNSKSQKLTEKCFSLNPESLVYLKSTILLPLFPLYSDGGLFSIFEGTDSYHGELYENCLSNIFSIKDPKPFFFE